MEWRDNKLIGIGAGIAFLICLAFMIIPFICRNIQQKKELEKAKQWMEYEKRRGGPPEAEEIERMLNINE
ncbi:MAG: hypothetical protein A3H23_03325 [Planctomycetes bacterium RIFCSPLOWO2_12_FULL_40_19]|nr:MAG: hypothetical protein A3H23_03325 [Planctomycetes bacterium RIFCSPLOWO2_12_FULL_40_19]